MIGLFVAAQEAVRHMGEGGRVINIGSINSDLVPFSGGAVYAATKLAGPEAAFITGASLKTDGDFTA
jgi:3-oxoacyl-[acyl-carrier protein] reductase